jgi:DNA-binding NtrC family response regulator
MAEAQGVSGDASSPAGFERYGDWIGASPASRKLCAQLRCLETVRANLVLFGESGTGKELIARAIHDHSLVRRGPLVVVNCGALDSNLVKSELFGHERGAFTGAVQRHLGAFVAADGGTLFLDEVAELPLDVQPVLLRAVEQRRIAAVGAQGERAVDVRIIVASHRDLATAVRQGKFREDLYYRLQVVRIHVPPLRERAEDIVLLAREFARRLGIAALPETFIEVLRRHDWPGNVRELRNAVEAYAAIGSVPRVTSVIANGDIDAALAEFVDPTRSYAAQKSDVLERFTRVYLRSLLAVTDGNKSKASRLSGLERSYLGKLADKFGLPRE